LCPRRIVNGEKPAEFSIQLGKKIVLAVNLRTAKALGPRIPFRAVKPQAGRAAFTTAVAPIASFNSNIAFYVQTELEGFAIPRRRPVPNSEGVSVQATDV
jgi:hypothetical protein